MHGAFSMPKSSNRIKKKRAGIPACGGLCVCAATNRTRPALEEAEKEEKMSVTFADGADPKAVMQDVLKNCKKVEDDCEIYL